MSIVLGMKEGFGRPSASRSGSSSGHPLAMWMLRVAIESSPWVMAAVPSPLWASTSMTQAVRIRSSNCSLRSAITRSFSRQNPFPKSFWAWCMPPPK